MIQQLAAQFKELTIKLSSTLFQPYSELGFQDPSLGTLVPADSGILVVAVQRLTEWNIFAHSEVYNLGSN